MQKGKRSLQAPKSSNNLSCKNIYQFRKKSRSIIWQCKVKCSLYNQVHIHLWEWRYCRTWRNIYVEYFFYKCVILNHNLANRCLSNTIPCLISPWKQAGVCILNLFGNERISNRCTVFTDEIFVLGQWRGLYWACFSAQCLIPQGWMCSHCLSVQGEHVTTAERSNLYYAFNRVFSKCTRMAIMPILASETLFRENKKIQLQNVTSVSIEPLDLWFQVQHAPLYTNLAFACKTETLGSLYSHALFIPL